MTQNLSPSRNTPNRGPDPGRWLFAGFLSASVTPLLCRPAYATTICQRLAALDTNVLLSYIRRGCLHTTAPGADEVGVCPVCGCELEYGSDVPLDDGGYHEWTCPGCGAAGKEMCGKVFEEHYDVRDGDGSRILPSKPIFEYAAPEIMAVRHGPQCGGKAVLFMNDDKTNMMPEMDISRLNAYFPRSSWNEYYWGFTCYSRQNYAGVVPLEAADEIMLGVQCEQGSCLCELAIRWHRLAGRPTPKLEVFRNAWPLLQTPTFAAVMEQLAQMEMDCTPTPDEVSALLIANGFQDESDQPLHHAEDSRQQEVHHD